MKVKLVTSFNKRIYDEYAQNSLKTWVDHLCLSPGSEIEVWINGPFPQGLPKITSNATPFKYKLLDTQSEGWAHFFDTFNNFPKPNVPQGQEYRFNFIPFSCKVYALAEAAFSCTKEGADFDLLCWIDADVVFKKDFKSEDIAGILGNHSLAWLDRGRPWAHGETGFIVCNARVPTNLELFFDTANVYGSGALFYHAEWHDAFIYTAQIRLKEFIDSNFKVLNLNKDLRNEQEQGLFPFKTSVLNEWMDHWKGPRKDNITGAPNANK